MNIAQVLSAAEEHLVEGRDAAAKQLFTEALEQPAGAVRAMAGLGKIALRKGDTETAQKLFGHALTQEPENAGLLTGLAAVYLATERLEEAETCLRRAMRLDSALVDAPVSLTLLCLMRQDLEGARTAAERAIEIAPDSTDALTALAQVEVVSGNIPTAIALLQQSLALDPRQVETLTTLGSLFLLTDEPAQALDCLEAARLQEPDAPPVLARLAQCRAALNQLEEAGTLARQAATLAPADPEVRNIEGAVLLDRGCFAEALTALQAAAELDPQNPEPLVNLARLLRRRNELEAALTAARQAITLSNGAHELACRIEADLLCLSGDWSAGWRSYDRLGRPDLPDDAVAVPDLAIRDFDPRLALIVDDFSSTLLGLRLLPQVIREVERLRLLCLPVFASFFQAIPGIASVHAYQEITLSTDIEAGETVLLLDDLPRLLRTEPRALPVEPLHLCLESVESDPEDSTDSRDQKDLTGDGPRIGLWWDDTPGGPDPQMLLTALPGRPVLLRECDDGQPLTLTDGQLPDILVPYSAEHLLDMAVALLSVDMVVTMDGPVAHLAANLGCKTLVLCQYDIPWYWQPCGPDEARWYPTARAVGRNLDGSWSDAAEACATFPRFAEAGQEAGEEGDG